MFETNHQPHLVYNWFTTINSWTNHTWLSGLSGSLIHQLSFATDQRNLVLSNPIHHHQQQPTVRGIAPKDVDSSSLVFLERKKLYTLLYRQRRQIGRVLTVGEIENCPQAEGLASPSRSQYQHPIHFAHRLACFPI